MSYPTEANIAMRWILGSVIAIMGLITLAVIFSYAEPLRQKFLVEGEAPALFFIGSTAFTLVYGSVLSFLCALFSSGAIRITIAGSKIT